MLLMTAAVFLSRAALSVGVILFTVLALFHRDVRQQLRTFATTPWLPLFSLLFFVPFVSGLWSTDVAKWSDVVRIKLPLLFFPLAFAGNWQLRPSQWRMLALVFLLLLCGGCVWGLVDYLANTARVHEGYLRAKTIITPLENDHVRFSWLVSVGVVLSVMLAEGAVRKTAKALFVILAVFFVVYLHVLSARTGLLSLYLFLAIYAGRRLFVQKRPAALALLATVLLLPVAAYFFLPTFRARMDYNRYDLSIAKKAEYLPGSNDGARIMSLKAGWQVLRENPLGVGAGDVMHEADKWYAANVPQALPSDKFYPSSEWLLYGAFAGWPGVALFTAVMLAPFFFRPQSGAVFWTGFHATAALSFLFDMGLEVQYGVFAYAFVALCWWKWSREWSGASSE